MTTVPRYAATVARVLLGGLFLYAGVVKFRDPQRFADAIYGYHVLPDTLINPLAAGLPVLEIVLGAMLLCGVARRVSAALTVLLYTAFILALGQALVRGLEIECGCFGGAAVSAGATLAAIARDVALLATAVFVFRAARVRAVDGQVELDHDH